MVGSVSGNRVRVAETIILLEPRAFSRTTVPPLVSFAAGPWIRAELTNSFLDVIS